MVGGWQLTYWARGGCEIWRRRRWEVCHQGWRSKAFGNDVPTRPRCVDFPGKNRTHDGPAKGNWQESRHCCCRRQCSVIHQTLSGSIFRLLFPRLFTNNPGQVLYGKRYTRWKLQQERRINLFLTIACQTYEFRRSSWVTHPHPPTTCHLPVLLHIRIPSPSSLQLIQVFQPR